VLKDFSAPTLIEYKNVWEGNNHTVTYDPVKLVWVNATDLSDIVVFRNQQSVQGVLDGGVIKYAGAFGAGIDFEITLHRSGFKKEIVIQSLAALEAPPTANHKLVALFKYGGTGLTVKDAKTLAEWDNDLYLESEDGYELSEVDTSKKSFIKPAYIVDSANSKSSIKVFWKLHNGSLYQAKVLPKTFLLNATFPVRADTVTSYYSGSGDGSVGFERTSTGTWSYIHDTATAAWANTAYSTFQTGGSDGCGIGSGFWNDLGLNRSFMPFNTAGLPDSAAITAASIYLYVTANYSTGGNASYDYYSIVETNQASNTALATGDYDECGKSLANGWSHAMDTDIIKLSADISSVRTNNAYNEFPLNSTGLAVVSKTGYTKLGMRNGYDISNVSQSTSTNTFTFFHAYTSEQTGTSQDPYLAVTYTLSSTDIEFDAVYGLDYFVGTSGTKSFTTSGPNRLLMVFVDNEGGADDFTGVTYNGAPMTEIGVRVQEGTTGRYSHTYALVNPALGTHDVVISRSSSNQVNYAIASYMGVRQSSLPTVYTTNQIASPIGTATTNLSTTVYNSWTVLFGRGGRIQTASTGSTMRSASGIGAIYDSNGPIAPVGVKSMAFTQSPDNAAVCTQMFQIEPAAHQGVYFGNTGSDLDQASGTSSYNNNGDLLIIYMNETAGTVSGITYGGVSMTQIGTQQYFSTYARYETAWYLVNPSQGSNAVVCSGGANWQFNYLSVLGASQITPISGATYVNSSGTDPSLSITTTVDNAIAVMCGQISAGADGGTTAGSGSMLIQYGAGGANYFFATTNPVTPAGSATVHSVDSTGAYFLHGFGINPATASELTSNIAGYWKLDESSGNAADSTANANTLTNNNTTTYGSAKINNGITANPTGTKYLSKTSPTGLPSGSSSATVSFWANPRVVQSTSVPGCVAWGAESNNQMCGLGFSSTGLFHFGYNNDAILPYSYSVGEWRMYTLTVNGTTKKVNFYVDGSPVGAEYTLTNTPNVGTSFVFVGAQRPGNLVVFDGEIDEAAIWSRVLSSAEVASLYNSGTGLQYPFEEIADNSIKLSNQYHLTPVMIIR
jgi:hypothetical protein